MDSNIFSRLKITLFRDLTELSGPLNQLPRGLFPHKSMGQCP